MNSSVILPVYLLLLGDADTGFDRGAGAASAAAAADVAYSENRLSRIGEDLIGWDGKSLGLIVDWVSLDLWDRRRAERILRDAMIVV